MHGSRYTGLQTGGFLTMAALKSKGEMLLLLDENARERTGELLFISLGNLLGLGMLGKAIYLTEPTADTDFFFYVNALHVNLATLG
jgi:hypothetical protein